MSLRSASEIPFLGKQPVNEISGAKLPTKLLIFCHFFYNHKELGKNTTDAIHATGKAVVTCWEEAGCKTKKIDRIKNDIKKWFTMHQVFTAHEFLKFIYHLHTDALLNSFDASELRSIQCVCPMTNSAPLFSYHKNLAKYRNDQRESKEFKVDLARLNEALEGGYDAAGPHAFEKKENLARGEFIEDQVLLWFMALLNYLG